VICECNDGYLNNIRLLSVKEEHVLEAIKDAKVIFEEGAVGAGTGMSCYGLKGGIGSASRIIEIDSDKYTVGTLVLSNFGRKEDLIVDGIKVGKLILEGENQVDKGSIIIIIATDLPLSERQLKRISKRATVGLARTGSFIGNGSGDVVIGFSTANKIKHYNEGIIDYKAIHDNNIDLVVLAGYMRILGPKIINEYHYRIINIHPALLPSFTGLDAQKQAIEYGVKISGCTVHFVDEGMDTGPIILQKAVEVKQTDDEESLAKRILKYEHKLLPHAIQLFAQKRITIKNNIVYISN